MIHKGPNDIIYKYLYIDLGAAPFKIKVNEKKFLFKNSHRAVVESDVAARSLANEILSVRDR